MGRYDAIRWRSRQTTHRVIYAPKPGNRDFHLESGQNMTNGIVNARRQIRHEEHIARLNGDKILDAGEITKDPSVFIVRKFGNVQINPYRVKTGDFLLLAEKRLVIVGSHRNRLIANYTTLRVRMPHQCEMDGIAHTMTVCTSCIHGSWTWDYLIRNISDMSNFVHGTNRAYDYFGCRCDFCTEAHQIYSNPDPQYKTRKSPWTMPDDHGTLDMIE